MRETIPQEMASFNAMYPGQTPALPVEEDGEQKRWGQMQGDGASGGNGGCEETSSVAPPAQAASARTDNMSMSAAPQGYAAPQYAEAPQAYPGNMGDPSYKHLGYPQYQYMYQPVQPPAAGPSGVYGPVPGFAQASAQHPGAYGAQRPVPPAGYAPSFEAPFPGVPAGQGMPYGASSAGQAQGMQAYPQPPNSFVQPHYAPGYAAGPGAPSMPFTMPGTMAAGPQEKAAPSKGNAQCNCNHGASSHEAEQPADPGAGSFSQMFGQGAFPGGNLFGAAFSGIPGFDPRSFAAQTGADDPKHLENRYGQMFELYSELMQGKTDPVKIAGLLAGNQGTFWKGAIVGALLAFIATNSSVKSALGESLSAICGASKPSTDK